MNILQIAPLTESLPTQGYGGTERVVHWLSQALSEIGHNVYVATLPNKKRPPVSYNIIELPLKPVQGKYEKQNYTKACKFLAENMPHNIDVVHGHSAGNIYNTREIGDGACEIRKYSKLPLLITIHGFKERLPKTDDIEVSFISRSQMQKYGYESGYIYNPINVSEYAFLERKENYLLWMSKLSWKEKGLGVAIEIAEECNCELVIAGPGLTRDIKKKIKGKIKYVGEVSGRKKAELLAKAKGFLHTAIWEEPFGIAVIEAMLSGTPVLAFDLGAMPEIIKHDKTGFICQDNYEMKNYLKELDRISPSNCRDWVINNFESHKIASEYLKLYKEMARQK
jgi:glycosyltransferase involved in cell wall biosynthesis